MGSIEQMDEIEVKAKKVTEEEKPQRRQFFRSILIFPGARLKLSTYYAFIGLCSVGILNFALVFFLINLVNYSGGEASGNFIADQFMTTLMYNQWLMVTLVGALSILFIGFAYVLSLNILGPMVPLLRHIEALRKGDYAHVTQLRKRDELKPLMHALNDLSRTLEEKHKNH